MDAFGVRFFPLSKNKWSRLDWIKLCWCGQPDDTRRCRCVAIQMVIGWNNCFPVMSTLHFHSLSTMRYSDTRLGGDDIWFLLRPSVPYSMMTDYCQSVRQAFESFINAKSPVSSRTFPVLIIEHFWSVFTVYFPSSQGDNCWGYPKKLSAGLFCKCILRDSWVRFSASSILWK